MHFEIKKIIFLAIIISYCVIGNSQNGDYLFCKIIDQETQDPVVFATVQIKSENLGVIADEHGFFRLPMNTKAERKFIILSSIGYKTNEFQAGDFSSDKVNILKLAPQVEALDAVNILVNRNKKEEPYISAEEIVKKAIFNIRLNFPTEPHSYIAYYRDYQLLNNQYFNLNEGIFEDFDAGIQTHKLKYKDNKTALYSFEQNSDFNRDSVLTVPYNQNDNKFMKNATVSGLGGNELSILNIHNAIRNYELQSFSFIDVFKNDFLHNHKFRIKSKVYQDNRTIYKLAFYALENVTGIYNSANGFIYIDSKSFAIHKLEYYGYNKKDEDPFYSLTVEYKPQDSKMYLNYISFQNKFKAKSAFDFRIDSMGFDANKNEIKLRFSKKIDQKTLKRKNQIKLIFKNEKLKVTSYKFLDEKTISLKIAGGSAVSNTDLAKDLEVKIRKIKDVAGRELNEIIFLDANQYRELFVQRVHIDKEPSPDLFYINKVDQLHNAKQNSNPKIDKTYWINSPLLENN